LVENRKEILQKLDLAFESIGMEKFIPDGSSSQEVCISNLLKSDIIIFLISPYYGSLMESCSLEKECKADCPMKTGVKKISYTHCEYIRAKAEDILHQTYLVLEGWDNPNLSKEALEFKQLIDREYRKEIINIEDPNLVKKICTNLADKIVDWHREKKLNFAKFCDRRDELFELIQNIDGKVEVYGVGGIGKTTLIQLALLIQRLKGRKVVTISSVQSYASGSGYDLFKEKCEEILYKVIGKKINLENILEALSEFLPIPAQLRKKSKDSIFQTISKVIEKEDIILLIDDFHLANEDVQKFVKITDNVILSSRRNSGIATKEIFIIGLKDIDCLINLACENSGTYLPDKVKEKIKTIAEGHPISTEILVRNYQKINFDKLKDFDLKNTNTTLVDDFYKRVIKDILSKKGFTLIKDLSVINNELESNISREIIEITFGIDNKFNELLDTGMLKKKKEKQGIYEFFYNHIQDALENKADKRSHKKAIKYYEKKKEILSDKYNIDDAVEVLFHKVKIHSTKELVNEFLEISDRIKPVHYGFKRLIDVGEELKGILKKKDKAQLILTLGNLYSDLRWFNKAEIAYLEALKRYKMLARKNRKDYIHYVAKTQNSLGNLYVELRRFKEAEKIYLKALEIRKELALNNLEVYLPDVAGTQNNLGTLYIDLRRYESAERAYTKALKIREELVKQNPQLYFPDYAVTKHNIGLLNAILGRFKVAEENYLEALHIREDLAKNNSDTYLPYVAETQNNLGNLYVDLNNFEKGEAAYLKALNIRKELAEKNNEVYSHLVARTQINIATLYWKLKRSKNAEEYYNNALDIYKKLQERNPEAHKSEIARTQNNLGNLYADTGRFDKAEIVYVESLQRWEELIEEIREAYLPDIAMTQSNLGTLYIDLKRFKEAKDLFLKALQIRKELAKKNHDAYIPDIARTQNNIGTLYCNLRMFEEAEKAYLEALQIRKELTEKTPEAFLPELAITLNALGNLYSDLKRFDKAEVAYVKALQKRKKLAKENNEAFLPDVFETLKNLGNLYIELRSFEKSEEKYNEILKIDPSYSSAWYGKACIESLKSNKENSIEFLKKAIKSDKDYVYLAKKEKKFNNIKDSTEFKDIIK